MKTSQKQISLFGEDELTSLRVDSHANHIQQPENGKAPMMSAICGPKCLEQLGKLNHVGSWAKTFTGLLIGQEGWCSSKSKLTWKMKGTKYNRIYFLLAVSTLRTEGREYGLLPTPQVVQRDHPDRVEKLKQSGAKTITSRKAGDLRPNSIMDAVQFYNLLPTPRKSDMNQPGFHGQGGQDLRTVISLIPTPNASDCGTKSTGLENQDSLTKRARLMTGQTSLLNPQFVLEMMNFPPNWTVLPFQNGGTNQSKEVEMQ